MILFTGEGCLADIPQADTPAKTATAADGTHPAGMHSCFICFLYRIDLNLFDLISVCYFIMTQIYSNDRSMPSFHVAMQLIHSNKSD